MTSFDQAGAAASERPDASRAGGPAIAVVLASTGSRNWLGDCLAVLAPECLRNGADLIVARAGSATAIRELSEAYPYARFIGAPPKTTTRELRRMGVAACAGDIIALLDDTDEGSLPNEHWMERLGWRPADSAGGRREADAIGTVLTADAVAGAPAVQLVPHPSSPTPVTVRQPYLSVVVPVRQGAADLRHSLEALVRSDLPRTEWELIVVDDASTDQSALVAADYADVVVRLPRTPRGPAYARNRGFEYARGEYVAFIDADVCVHRDTLARFVLVLSREPEVSAVFGSFDASPPARGLVSRYRNLLAHYYHHAHAGPAETFWASCGAIRRGAFLDAGLFDEWRFSRRQIEDFELGYQLRERGHRIVLRPAIQATSLKRWTLATMTTAEFQDRTVPWMRIFDRRAPAMRRRRTRLRTVKTVNTGLVWLAASFLFGGLWAARVWPFVIAAACLQLVVVNDLAKYRLFAREQGLTFALAAVPLQMLSYAVNGLAVTLGWVLREFVGEPAPPVTVEAFSEVGVKMWPPVPTRRAQDTRKTITAG